MAAASTVMQNVSHNQIWNFPKLKGQENYEPWSRKMRNALIYCGLWEIVETGKDSFPEDTATTAPQRLTHEAAVRTWEEKNSQGAALIYSMCEDKPAEAIEEEVSSHDRWEKLESNYVSSGFILRVTKFLELLSTRLSTSNNSLETYVAGIRNKAKELNRMSAPIPDWILVTMLLNNLDGKFKEFVHRLLVHMKDKTPDFDEIVALLYDEERLLKKDTKDQALFKAMKKFNRDQEDKKRSSSSKKGGSGGNNSNGPKPSKNPNSNNYKGDGKPPECPKCPPTDDGKKRCHWPFNCWSLHEEKAAPWFKDLKKNNKANKATGSTKSRRPDDFDDSNTLISALEFKVFDVDEEEVSFEDFWGVQQLHSETPEEEVETVVYGNSPHSPPHSPCDQESTPDLLSSVHFKAHMTHMIVETCL